MEKYIYLDKEKAKLGVALVYTVSNKKIMDYEKQFRGNAIEFCGENLPHFITYLEETGTIREATEEEKLARGNRVLFPGEILIDGVITSYDLYAQKVVEGQIVDKTRQDYIDEGILTSESEKEKARKERTAQFKFLDLYDKAVLIGDVVQNEEQKQLRDDFRNSWRALPSDYIDLSKNIEGMYPIMPSFIKKLES